MQPSRDCSSCRGEVETVPKWSRSTDSIGGKCMTLFDSDFECQECGETMSDSLFMLFEEEGEEIACQGCGSVDIDIAV